MTHAFTEHHTLYGESHIHVTVPSDVFPHTVSNNCHPTGLIMIGVIIASRKVGINPDNVATPIAASLGDLITLSLLAGVSTGLYKELGNKRTSG